MCFLFENQKFSITKMHLEMSSAKCRPCCLRVLQRVKHMYIWGLVCQYRWDVIICPCPWYLLLTLEFSHRSSGQEKTTLIARLMWPTWGPAGSWWPQVGPMLATWPLLSVNTSQQSCSSFFAVIRWSLIAGDFIHIFPSCFIVTGTAIYRVIGVSFHVFCLVIRLWPFYWQILTKND